MKHILHKRTDHTSDDELAGCYVCNAELDACKYCGKGEIELIGNPNCNPFVWILVRVYSGEIPIQGFLLKSVAAKYNVEARIINWDEYVNISLENADAVAAIIQEQKQCGGK